MRRDRRIESGMRRLEVPGRFTLHTKDRQLLTDRLLDQPGHAIGRLDTDIHQRAQQDALATR
ncbi:Uncharacterised protein [Mycobacteroides abscessus subsp. abscessus]|nr:Uncharacterised protein [Mycobacteroides abscessus subsp. abscessus]